MKYTFCFIAFSLLMLIVVLSSYNHSAIGYTTKVDASRCMKKIEFDGHSYIFLQNTWSCAGDQLLHDPDCQCFGGK